MCSRAVPYYLAKTSKKAAALVHLADILARGMDYGWPGDMTMPPLNHEAFHGLAVSYDRIDAVLKQAEIEYAAGVDVFALRDPE